MNERMNELECRQVREKEVERIPLERCASCLIWVAVKNMEMESEWVSRPRRMLCRQLAGSLLVPVDENRALRAFARATICISLLGYDQCYFYSVKGCPWIRIPRNSQLLSTSPHLVYGGVNFTSFVSRSSDYILFRKCRNYCWISSGW